MTSYPSFLRTDIRSFTNVIFHNHPIGLQSININIFWVKFEALREPTGQQNHAFVISNLVIHAHTFFFLGCIKPNRENNILYNTHATPEAKHFPLNSSLNNIISCCQSIDLHRIAIKSLCNTSRRLVEWKLILFLQFSVAAYFSPNFSTINVCWLYKTRSQTKST